LDEATRVEFMDTLYQETDRLKKMVNDVLDFSKLQEEATLRRDWQDIAPIINLTVQSFKVLAKQKELAISTNIESNLPQLLIHSETIERVMRNLLSNAIKYTDQGGRVKVRAELADDDELGQCVEISVEDTGIGIQKHYLPKIFDRFFRVENDVHTVKGTGLGLHLVKVAIEKHHDGEVFVTSEAGKGSTFGFRLPVEANKPQVTEV
jgi:two-component system sensor histidine kinase NblS